MANVSFKIQFEEEIRRIALAARPSFDELRTLIAKLFVARQLDSNFTLKYVDDEGDHVTLGSDLELECAINAAKVGTLRLIVSVPVAPPVSRCGPGNRRGWHHHHQQAQTATQPQAQAQPQAQPQAQQVFEFLKSFGCPASEQIFEKIEAFMRKVGDFKSADQFISEAVAELEKLLANPELRAVLPIQIQPESVREFVAPFLENPFIQQTITTFFDSLKQETQQPQSQSQSQSQPQPNSQPQPTPFVHPLHRFRRAPMFNPGSGNPNEEVHFGVICDGCQAFPLRGVRHRCTSCLDYDLCQSCLDKGIHKETTHAFVQVPPHPRPHPFSNFGGRCGRRRGVFQQPAQQQAEPVKAEVPQPVKTEEAPQPVKTEEAPQLVKTEEPAIAPVEPVAVVEEVATLEDQVSLEKLASMGFLNREVNLRALHTAGGDLWEALQIILQQ